MSKDPLYGEKEEVSEADAGKKTRKKLGNLGILMLNLHKQPVSPGSGGLGSPRTPQNSLAKIMSARHTFSTRD